MENANSVTMRVVKTVLMSRLHPTCGRPRCQRGILAGSRASRALTSWITTPVIWRIPHARQPADQQSLTHFFRLID
ncbi:MAG: hypothetical protein JWN03_7038 [Nocardia sp.]|nr:hypothetical protein [Nocardia sp.]